MNEILCDASCEPKDVEYIDGAQRLRAAQRAIGRWYSSYADKADDFLSLIIVKGELFLILSMEKVENSSMIIDVIFCGGRIMYAAHEDVMMYSIGVRTFYEHIMDKGDAY